MKAMMRRLERLKSWEGLLLAILIVIVVLNTITTPHYLRIQNQINLFQLNIEKDYCCADHDLYHHQRRD